MRPFATGRFILTAIAWGLLIYSCVGKSSPTTFYTLSPIEADPAAQTAFSAGQVNIGIGPVTFPDELDRQRIVTRSGRNQLAINEFHRWGGSLEKNFARVLVENLTLLLGSERIMAQPWERYFSPDFRVVLDIRRFDGRLGEYASLNATWMLVKAGSDQPVVIRQTIIQEATAGKGYDSLVAAQSAAAATLSREIAAVLQKQIAAKP
jgi:hypothetical protein